MIRIFVVVSGAALALAACNPPAGSGSASAASTATTAANDPTTASATGAAAAGGAATAAPANTEGAEAFARSLFAQYAGPNAQGLPNAQIYTPATLALIDADRPRGGDGVGYLDFDPICGCQDNGAIVVDRVALTPGPEGRTWAAVTFTDREAVSPTTQQPGDTRTRRFLLERTSAGWRVADIASDEAGDNGIVAGMREHARQFPTPAAQ